MRRTCARSALVSIVVKAVYVRLYETNRECLGERGEKLHADGKETCRTYITHQLRLREPDYDELYGTWQKLTRLTFDVLTCAASAVRNGVCRMRRCSPWQRLLAEVCSLLLYEVDEHCERASVCISTGTGWSRLTGHEIEG